MKKTILITWWTGYIWSHAVVAFEQAWYKTVIVDNLVNSSKKSLDGIKNILGYQVDFFELDLRDKEALREVFQKYEFDGVLHFAGLKAVWESCQKPLEYFDNNINGSVLLFELMQEFLVKNIIFSSSATVYKVKNDGNWYTETDEVWACSNPYGTTKFLLENILKEKNIDLISIAYHSESLLPQFDTFAQSLITNEQQLPCMVLNSKLASALYF